MTYHQTIASLAVALVLLIPAASFAQTNIETQSRIIALLQQVITLLRQISDLRATEAAALQSNTMEPATPPGATTTDCMPMTDVQTSSGRNSCGDLYCPDKLSTHRYYCRAGKNTAAWYSSAYPCTGLSCSI